MRPADPSAAEAAGQAWLRSARPTSPSERLVMALLAQMPADMRSRFDDAQVEALREAARHCQWGRHPLDFRLSLPLLAQRYYLVIVGGRERRSAERRQRDAQRANVWLRGALLGLAVVLVLMCLRLVGGAP
jgi:hypothetical protein